jgi:hypothetical protein
MSARLAQDRRRLRAGVVVCALLSFYMWRFVMYSDGISYLDIADRYKAGAWREAVNPYWSPLYSWVLAVATLPLGHGSYYEVVVVHLVNLIALLLSFAAFELLLRELELPGRAALGVAYSLFLWGAVGLIGCAATMPDLIVTIWVYLLTVLVMRFRKDESRLAVELGLGAIVALAYFTKTAMLLIGTAYIITAAVGARRARVAVMAGLACLILASPWVWTLREVAGRWTIGESGRLNYAWEVHDIRRATDWPGGGALHSVRQFPTSPPVFEYAEPIRATYPLWFDPSYWYAGLRTPIAVDAQLLALMRNGVHAGLLLLLTPGLVVGLFLVCWGRLGAPKILLAGIPAVAAVAMYALVFVEARYLSAYLVVIGLAVVAGWSNRPLSRWPRRLLGLNVFVACAWFLSWIPGAVMLFVWQVVTGGTPLTNPHWRVAQEMRALGMNVGDRIAYVGLPITAYWARLAGVEIIAEVPTEYDRVGLTGRLRYGHSQTDAFWRADPSGQQLILDAFARTGARWVVADIVPSWANTAGWTKLRTLQRGQRAGSMETYARPLHREPG